MATYHILNGDSLAEQLKQTRHDQNHIVCRECLIEGDLNAANDADFWAVRAKFIANTYQVPAETYFSKTVAEFDKMISLPDNSDVCLWFENDLFCQANLWFILSLLSRQPSLNLFRVFPVIENIRDTWKGFGISTPQMLEQSYASKIPFTSTDIELGKNLWTAYKSGNRKELKELSRELTESFLYLEEVCQAHTDRFPADKSMGRPEKTVKEIIETKSTDFRDVFSEFFVREGIYGFSDLQVKNIYDRYFNFTLNRKKK